MQLQLSLPDASLTTPTTDWSYVSEGGASIVFSYVGPPHPIFDGTVLRLRKAPRQHSDSLQHLPPPLHDLAGETEPDDPSIAFQHTVTSKLVLNEHLPKLQTVKVSSEWLQELAVVTEERRPTARTVKDGIDISRTKGVLATDLVGGEGWAVEIKPKWGFLPTTTYLSSATLPLKSRHCRFCMHVHLKDKKEASVAGGYCPLDLFSGDQTRVKRALTRLWDAWVRTQGKVNNLRIFFGGEIVNPGKSTSYGLLASQFGLDPVSSSLADLQPQFIDVLLPLLMGTSLLSTLSYLQRTLDSLDIEGLSRLWSRSYPGVPLGEGFSDPTLAEWHEFVDKFRSTDASKDAEGNLHYSILAYLLSATFKDCSIILRLGRKGADGAGRVGDTITAIDLDPKSVDRLARWEELDRSIVTNFEGIAAELEECVDARGKV